MLKRVKYFRKILDSFLVICLFIYGVFIINRVLLIESLYGSLRGVVLINFLLGRIFYI